MRSPWAQLSSLKAPAPTGLVPKSSPAAFTAASGRIEAENIARVESSGADGSLVVMITVLSSGALTSPTTWYIDPMTESLVSRRRSKDSVMGSMYQVVGD